MKKLFILGLSVVMCGCSGMRQSENTSAQSVAASHDLKVQRITTMAPAPKALPTAQTVTVAGSNNTVTVTGLNEGHEHVREHGSTEDLTLTEGADVNGRTSQLAKAKTEFSVSTWLAVGFAAAFLSALGVVYILVTKLTAQGHAADRAFAGLTNSVSNMAARTNDNSVALEATQLKSKIEEMRGKFASGAMKAIVVMFCALMCMGMSKPRKTQSFGKVPQGAATILNYRKDWTSTNGGFPLMECFVCNVPLGTNMWKLIRVRTDVPTTTPGAVFDVGVYKWPSYIQGCRAVGSPYQYFIVRQ